MNGPNGVAVPPGLWSEARSPDGRVYYYNTVTKATQWTKPPELMTPAEVNRPLQRDDQVDAKAARTRQSTMARAHDQGGEEVLVQQGNEAELVGDTRRVQGCYCSGCASG